MGTRYLENPLSFPYLWEPHLPVNGNDDKKICGLFLIS